MLRVLRLALAVAVLTLMVRGGPAYPQNVFEKLVNPGDLIQGHAKYEKDCNACHVPFSRQSQTQKCLDCHKEVAADRNSEKGFHGRNPQAAKSECRHCHGDHKGRDADVVGLDVETFNHAFTDFTLEGRHKTAQCGACHAKGIKFAKAPSACYDCHKKDDPHKGRLGEKCDTCHAVKDGWRKTHPFDHSKTKFPLKDAHVKVNCQACHVGERYKDLPTTCVSCHRIQDVHQGRYGGKCESCHASTKWKEIHFDHDKTKFPLRGGHAKAKCDKCHSGNLYADKLETACVTCHKKDDPHEGRLGRQCENCHKDTGWRSKTAFDHDLTRFPLIGLHAAVPCEECHVSSNYKGTQRDCHACHKDDHHKGTLGAGCASCHNPNGWAFWRFDHDRSTKYPLTGAHKGLECAACHKQQNVKKAVAPTNCNGCHAADDAHQGAFGKACESCHTTTRFRQTKLRR